MPPPFFQHDENVVLHNERHYIEADEAKAILKIKGVLIHPGLREYHSILSSKGLFLHKHSETFRFLMVPFFLLPFVYIHPQLRFPGVS